MADEKLLQERIKYLEKALSEIFEVLKGVPGKYVITEIDSDPTPIPSRRPRNLHTVQSAAEFLGVNPNAMRKWCSDGKLPARRFKDNGVNGMRRGWRIDHDDLVAFYRSNSYSADTSQVTPAAVAVGLILAQTPTWTETQKWIVEESGRAGSRMSAATVCRGVKCLEARGMIRRLPKRRVQMTPFGAEILESLSFTGAGG